MLPGAMKNLRQSNMVVKDKYLAMVLPAIIPSSRERHSILVNVGGLPHLGRCCHSTTLGVR